MGRLEHKFSDGQYLRLIGAFCSLKSVSVSQIWPRTVGVRLRRTELGFLHSF
jgi:hypothetical protein